MDAKETSPRARVRERYGVTDMTLAEVGRGPEPGLSTAYSDSRPQVSRRVRARCFRQRQREGGPDA